MENNHEGAPATGRRDRIITLLAEYPSLESDDLEELLHWFRKEASALDVGLISSDPRLAVSYEVLKQDHLDRLTGSDLFWFTIVVGTGFVVLAMLVWPAT
ncbi:hypothetical protein [uncultured Erythrobacter sp.]|uniref:hypothetical protein n=1 Tax=uncultured Erythrobacter sp. TaxID=263913 RepID=UPI002659E2C8|nr:hypothetical protein [uncultured Erythrobacter sp.]